MAEICDHSRAYEYFAESIHDNKFLSKKCNKARDECKSEKAYMGGEPGNLGKGVEGFYLLTTNAESPYGKGIA